MGYLSDSEQKKIFSYNLEELVSMSGKDQKQIAVELDVNPPTFNQWVMGKAIPSVSMLKRISAYFNVTLSQLVDETQPKVNLQTKLTNRELALVSAYRKTSNGIKDAVDKLLDVDYELDFLIQMGELKEQMDSVAKKIESVDK